jgi:acetylornithine/succinyldiaminopimelate/putrescine aminotransferase/predicted amino acid dehydrogenase
VATETCTTKFAFLVHPLTEETKALLQFDAKETVRNRWGADLLGFCSDLHRALAGVQSGQHNNIVPRTRVVDELAGLVSFLGARAEGRLYEIPMDAMEIIDDPARAMAYMEEAVDQAAEWGAKLVGLGSMTGIIGGNGEHLADRGPIAVTTGNSLTVYAALQNLYQLAREVDVDLSRETVAIVGIPGSIAAAAACALAPRCKELLLVARRTSTRATKLAQQLGAELLFDIPEALARARIIFSATSTGDCIDQKLLRPGALVVDVAVPTDVQGNKPLRNDVLIASGGLAKVPDTMSFESNYLWFHQGMVPSCLAETMVLALEQRAECFSLGRNLSLDAIYGVGQMAEAHGFDFSRLFSWGQPLDDSALVEYRKAALRRHTAHKIPAPHFMLSARNGHAGTNGHASAAELNGSSRSSSAVDPLKSSARAANLYARHINPVLVALGAKNGFVKTFVRGEGNYLWDAEGRKYLDFVSGFGSLNLGHNHPAVTTALSEALRQQAPGFAQSAVNPFAAALAEELAIVSPSPLEMVFFCNSGSEAVEAALKLARQATGRTGLLSCHHSYHGKTFGSLSVTGNSNYQRPFGPLLPDCESIPYGNLTALERALANQRMAGFVVEPIQAEGGMIVPPVGYLRAAQSMCRAAGTLLIVDEVQTGLGRTGKLFAVNHEGVEPDVITLAKSLGGGLMPIGAMLSRRDHWMQAYGTMQTFALHTSTFGGGSLACAAGLAAVRTIREEKLAENAEERGHQLYEGLKILCLEHDFLSEVRGRGLLLGLEFNPTPSKIVTHGMSVDNTGLARYLIPNHDELLNSIPAMYVMQNLLQTHGIYTQVARSNPRVLRIQPPLTITEEQVNEFLTALDTTCREVQFAHNLFDGIIAKSGTGQHQAASGS